MLAPLDQLTRNPSVADLVKASLGRVTDALQEGQQPMAWETLPLSSFGVALPDAIVSCWVFVIRPGLDTGAERHPNSHQRSMSLTGQGEFHLRSGRQWRPHALVSSADASLERRWVSIPPNTWHRLLVGDAPWGMLSFHTVREGDLIEERPSTSDLDDGPTSSRRYADHD
ncbi:MAG TPA: hypothetical protein VJT32_11880 [bacterium]|nr:hypothetical protein [bacterium]